MSHRKIAELRRRGTELRAQSQEITYLNALRAALNKEKQRRENTVHQTEQRRQTVISNGLQLNRAKTTPPKTTQVPETKQVMYEGRMRDFE